MLHMLIATLYFLTGWSLNIKAMLVIKGKPAKIIFNKFPKQSSKTIISSTACYKGKNDR